MILAQSFGRWRRLLPCLTLVAAMLVVFGPTGPSIADGGGRAPARPAMGSWPQPRFNARGTSFNASETALGTGNVASLSLRWSATGTTYLPGSPPVVSADGTVFVGTTGLLTAFRAADGSRLWTAQVPGPQPEPNLAGGLVVVAGDDTIEAFDASGVTNCSGSPKICLPVWTTNAPVDVEAPVHAAGMLFAGSLDAKVIAFNADTGKIRWTFDTSNGSFSGVYSIPAVFRHVVFVTCANHLVYALDASSGALMWAHDTGAFIYAPPAVAHGRVYVESLDGILHVLSAATGDELWTANMHGAAYGGVAIGPKIVYVNGSVIEAFDLFGRRRCSGTPKVCHPLWRGQPGDGESAPAVANGVLYVSVSTDLHAYDAETGDELWNHAILFNSGTASPSVANGSVYVVSEAYPNYEVDAFGLP